MLVGERPRAATKLTFKLGHWMGADQADPFFGCHEGIDTDVEAPLN